MLNRLFVIIGFLVILAIAAAFIVPRFIQWGDYRTRLEAMAAQAFGTEVAITGDIHLTLLPQPEVEFTKVRVGPEAAPALQVETVSAQFSLFDFLRDQYKVTQLKLIRPVLNFAVAADGSFGSGFMLTAAGESNVSIADADVVDGTVQIADARSGKTYVVDAVAGQLRLEALQGPFSFQGTANAGAVGYGVRVSSGKLDPTGATTLSVYLKASDGGFTFESNGALQAGAAPKYLADVTYRLQPPKPKEGEAADAGRGDFVLEGKIEAAPDRVLLSTYTAVPDENRAATRLTGAAELKIGKDTAFNAVISGGVIALPPRDATTELTDPPYELVRLLGETPLPPIPPIPGTIGLDIAELNLRAVTLRDVRLDAVTDGASWQIKESSAALAGGTTFGLSGNLSVVDGKPIFAGGVTIDSQQLDRLAALWRKPADGNPLFNMPGSLTANVGLSSDTLTLTAGTLVVAGINQGFDAQIGFGAQRTLKLSAQFTTLGDQESAAFAALMPDVVGNGSFGATFPKGQIDVSASKAVLFGLDGTELAASVNWEGGVLEFSKLSATDLGGAAFDLKLTAFGTLAKPELSGSGKVLVEDDQAPILKALLGPLNTPPALESYLRGSLPAALNLQLDAPSGDGGQLLKVTGRAATSDLSLQAKLTNGIASALTAPVTATLDLTSGSPTLMLAQLGLGHAAVFDERTPLHFVASIEGVPSNSYEVHASLAGGDDHLAFTGNVTPGDFSRISGAGDLDAKLADPSGLVEMLGAAGIYVPAVEGTARLKFTGLDSLALDDIKADGVSGALALTRLNDVATVSGNLVLASLDLRDLLPMLAGASGTLDAAGGLWPDGPIDIGSAPRSTEGRIDVSVGTIPASGSPLLTGASFGLDWDDQSVHLRALRGSVGGGELGADVTVCCSTASLPAKRINGRFSLNGVALDAVSPGAIGSGLDGSIDASAQFDGTGASVAEAIAAMTGSGSYTINGFAAAHFDPAVFDGVGALAGVVDMTPEALSAAVTEKLTAAPFLAPTLTGSFTIAGGTLRSPNLAIAGAGARIFGRATLSLKDLTVNARYAMTPNTSVDPGSAVDATTAEVAAVVTGPMWAPDARYDLSALVDGMKIKASEVELARLEQLRAEDEARQKAEAADRARVAAEQAAAEAAKQAAAERAAADAAAKAAADEAAKKAAADAAAKAAAQKPAQPVDLGL